MVAHISRERGKHLVADYALVHLPVWIIAIRDPAHAYMLLSSGVPRPRPRFRRQRENSGWGYVLVSSERAVRMAQLTDEEMQRLRAQGAEASRLFISRVHEVEQRRGEILRATAAELVRVGAATLRTTAGDIHARVIRFRNQAVVIEIVYRGGWSQARASQSTVTESCVHGLASALAQESPDAEPCSRGDQRISVQAA